MDASRTEGTYEISASDYTTDASGTGATFSIAVNSSGAATVTVVNPGSGFAVNETFTITDANLGGGGGASLTFDAATVSTVNTWVNGAIKFPANDLGTKLSDDWTLEFMIHKDSTEYNRFSQTEVTLVAIGDATAATGGLWLYYDLSSGKLELVVTNNVTTINAGLDLLSSLLKLQCLLMTLGSLFLLESLVIPSLLCKWYSNSKWNHCKYISWQ